jgi:hypothetical protein
MDLSDHLGPRFSIFCQISIVLELDHRRLGDWAENAVDLPRVEPKGAEPGLELGNVLTAHHGAAKEEHSITEAITGLSESP